MGRLHVETIQIDPELLRRTADGAVLTPEILAVDEIGSRTDKEAIDAVMNCGCCLLATAHGASMEKMQMRPALRQMAEEKIFERTPIGGTSCWRRITPSAA